MAGIVLICPCSTVKLQPWDDIELMWQLLIQKEVGCLEKRISGGLEPWMKSLIRLLETWMLNGNWWKFWNIGTCQNRWILKQELCGREMTISSSPPAFSNILYGGCSDVPVPFQSQSLDQIWWLFQVGSKLASEKKEGVSGWGNLHGYCH